MNHALIKQAQVLTEQIKKEAEQKEAALANAFKPFAKSLSKYIQKGMYKITPTLNKAKKWYNKQPKLIQNVVRTTGDAAMFGVASVPVSLATDAALTGYRASLEKKYNLTNQYNKQLNKI